MPQGNSFTLQVGAKRQITIPVKLLNLLELEEGSQIRVEVDGPSATLTPLIGVPRNLVSQELLRQMMSRRGAKSSDLTMEQFTQERTRKMGKSKPAVAKIKTTAPHAQSTLRTRPLSNPKKTRASAAI